MKIKNKRINDWINVTIGVMITAFSFSFFLEPNSLVIGGVSGVGIILKSILETDVALIILIINVVLLLLGLIFLGKEFFIKTVYGSLAFPGFIKIFDLLYGTIFKNGAKVSEDILVVIIFSAILSGFGIGLALKHGGTTGGTEIPQAILFKYFHIPYSASLVLIDGGVVILGCILLKDYDLFLYAIIFIYLSGIVMDNVVFNGFNKRAVHIISNKNEEIQKRIIKELIRGVTKLEVIGCYSNEKKTKLLCVLSNFEYYKLKAIINELDPKAFFYTVRANEVNGEGFTYE